MASSSPTCSRYPLQPSKVAKKVLATLIQIASGFAISALLFSGLVVSLVGASNTLGLLLVLFGLAALLLFAYERAYFDRYYYDLAPDVLVIKKGVFSYGETTLPYSRIQDVFLDQDVLDQFFGLYDLHVSSATLQSATYAHIDGLSFAGAEAIKKELLGKMLKGRKRR